jgi:hypothetical protein
VLFAGCIFLSEKLVSDVSISFFEDSEKRSSCGGNCVDAHGGIGSEKRPQYGNNTRSGIGV